MALALAWLVSFLPPCETGERPQERPRLVLSPAVTGRHQGTLSHETCPSEMKHPSEGMSQTGVTHTLKR